MQSQPAQMRNNYFPQAALSLVQGSRQNVTDSKKSQRRIELAALPAGMLRDILEQSPNRERKTQQSFARCVLVSWLSFHRRNSVTCQPSDRVFKSRSACCSAQSARGIGGDDAAFFEQDHAIGHLLHFAQRVGGKKQSRPVLAHQVLFQQSAEIRGSQRVEAARG